ncbi:ParB N-terminal domain-containing protein [Enterococcus faecalis]|nr:ParB N-terminal domain-containing protein [Enterococcus faecalis]
MDIKVQKTEDLIPYEKNPRHNEDAITAVAKSIEKFGFKVPIVVDASNVIVNGHTRLKAAKYLGLKEVPTIIADDLTPEQIKAFRLADNKVGEIATWDEELLNAELDELADLDFDMTEFGFDLPDIEGEEVEVIEDEQTTILNFDRPTVNKEHPTMKPVALFDYQIKNSSKQGDCILDLFGGSGTTLIACKQNEREAYLMELDPRYVDVIIARWEAFTGEVAVKISGNDTAVVDDGWK